MRRDDLRELGREYEPDDEDVDWRFARRLGVFSLPLAELRSDVDLTFR